eukprot:3708375-Lingulodinium_polyedra.AAC.1
MPGSGTPRVISTPVKTLRRPSNAAGGNWLSAAGVQSARAPFGRNPGRAHRTEWAERCSRHPCTKRQSSEHEADMARKSMHLPPRRSLRAAAREWIRRAPQRARSWSKTLAIRVSPSSLGCSKSALASPPTTTGPPRAWRCKRSANTAI